MKVASFGQTYFINQLPKDLDAKNSILVFDRILLKKHSAWIKKFPCRLAVSSGESLKQIKNFPPFLEKLVEMSSGIPRTELKIIAFGGGSVGDFSGFVASILKRGVSFVQIPSTWLAAMDSAHGGKTALNVGGLKNQVGSFHFPKHSFLVKEVLMKVPDQQLQDAMGEFNKMLLIAGGKLWKSRKPFANKKADSNLMWKNLPSLIYEKMKVVKKDPFESKGYRHVLNLGHTVGHVLESELGLSHGNAVNLGLRFSLTWGAKKGYYRINEQDLSLPSEKLLQQQLRKIKDPMKTLLQDKKIAAHQEIRFVFVKRPGKLIVEKIKLAELMKEWKRQC